MKRTILFFGVLMLLPSLFSYAQAPQGRRTAYVAKDETAPEVMLGRINTTNTSREMVLLDPRLIVQQVNCEVAGYTFSMSSGSKTVGPIEVKGQKLTDEIKQKIVDWDAPDVTVSFQDIRVKCNGREAMAKPVVLKYNH